MMQWDDRKGKYIKPFTKKSSWLSFFSYPRFNRGLVTQEMKDNLKKPFLEQDTLLNEQLDKLIKKHEWKRNLWILTRLGPIGIIILTLKLGGII